MSFENSKVIWGIVSGIAGVGVTLLQCYKGNDCPVNLEHCLSKQGDLQNQIQLLQTHKTELEKQVFDLQKLVGKDSAMMVRSLTDQVKELESTNSNLKNQLTQQNIAKESCESLKNPLKNCEQGKSNLETKLRGVEVESRELKEQIRNYQQVDGDYKNCQQDRNNLRNQLSSCQKAESENDSFKSQLTNCQQDKGSLKNQLKSCENTEHSCDNFRSQLNSCQQEKDSLRSQLNTRRNQPVETSKVCRLSGSGYTYLGNCSNGQANGWGVMYYRQRRILVGNFSEGDSSGTMENYEFVNTAE